MANSQKWKSFELVMAKALSEWYFGDQTTLRRSPCSGGWPLKRAEGDIVATTPEFDKEFPWCVDAKQRKGGSGPEWHLEQLLTAKKHPILDWWFEMNDMAPVKAGKQRMVVFSKTAGLANALMVIGRKEFQWLKAVSGPFSAIPSMHFVVGRCEDPTVETERLTFMKFNDFLDYVDGKAIRQLVQEKGGWNFGS